MSPAISLMGRSFDGADVCAADDMTRSSLGGESGSSLLAPRRRLNIPLPMGARPRDTFNLLLTPLFGLLMTLRRVFSAGRIRALRRSIAPRESRASEQLP